MYVFIILKYLRKQNTYRINLISLHGMNLSKQDTTFVYPFEKKKNR